MQVLAVNAGSSSLKLAVFDVHSEIARAVTVRIDRIGDGRGRLVVRGRGDRVERDESQDVQDHAAAFRLAADAVPALLAVDAVGHRVVRGGARHHRPTTIAPDLVDELRATASLDPEHGPQQYAIAVPAPATERHESTRRLGAFLRDVFTRNASNGNFRLTCPDEMTSNRLNAVFEVENRCFVGPTLSIDDHVHPDGRVMEVLSEHLCEGWLEGYLLTGRHGLYVTYEAFAMISASMTVQHSRPAT